MTPARVPRWLLWAGLTLGVWIAWFAVLRRPMTTMIAKLEKQKRETEQRLDMLKARLDNVPFFVSTLDSTYKALESSSRRAGRVSHIDRLVEDLRGSGYQRGLRDIVVEPDLGSLLTIGAPGGAGPEHVIHLDTLLIAVGGTADFISTGRWLDELETRRDFRQWVECHWTDPDGDGDVRFSGQIALLVINEPESRAPLTELLNGHD